jgi:hypothetical protein
MTTPCSLFLWTCQRKNFADRKPAMDPLKNRSRNSQRSIPALAVTRALSFEQKYAWLALKQLAHFIFAEIPECGYFGRTVVPFKRQTLNPLDDYQLCRILRLVHRKFSSLPSDISPKRAPEASKGPLALSHVRIISRNWHTYSYIGGRTRQFPDRKNQDGSLAARAERRSGTRRNDGDTMKHTSTQRSLPDRAPPTKCSGLSITAVPWLDSGFFRG